MYPLKFESIYLEKIWGGRELEKFRDDIPKGNIGESLDLCCYKNSISIIKNGELKGKKLKEAIKKYKEKLLGTHIIDEYKRFPLILKIITAEDNLSVQLHPGRKDKLEKGENSKAELWYIVDAKPNAFLVLGSKIKDKKSLKHILKKGELENYLNKVKVAKGDIFYVNSGLIHAIGKGITLVEIQESSDTTYRLYDYNRGRKLDIDKALKCIDLDIIPERKKGISIKYNGYIKTYYSLSQEFSVELYKINKYLEEESDKERFFTFTCVEGEGILIYDGGKENIEKGETILIPAFLGKYRIKGKLEILKFYVPDIKKVEKQILDTIKNSK
ncbi:type I phosphomannose isomerase catalytic subunit [Clostridium niameyense]|uniref:type I phosphomannose isomerase catalytic subunit n=1 Tax=Clostridium niameyense TaxID=1622073 RepID=UPI00067EC272|nr:type I phosphomannose isomerase catalytic subunit [Clostridium niameyense]